MWFAVIRKWTCEDPQTATGDMVEAGSDTHVVVQVNFVTTTPARSCGKRCDSA